MVILYGQNGSYLLLQKKKGFFQQISPQLAFFVRQFYLSWFFTTPHRKFNKSCKMSPSWSSTQQKVDKLNRHEKQVHPIYRNLIDFHHPHSQRLYLHTFPPKSNVMWVVEHNESQWPIVFIFPCPCHVLCPNKTIAMCFGSLATERSTRATAPRRETWLSVVELLIPFFGRVEHRGLGRGSSSNNRSLN